MRPSLLVYHHHTIYAPLDSYDTFLLLISTLCAHVIRKICRSLTHPRVYVYRLKQVQLVRARSEWVTELWVLNIGPIHAVDRTVFGREQSFETGLPCHQLGYELESAQRD